MNRPLMRLGRTVGICCAMQLLLVVSLKSLIEPGLTGVAPLGEPPFAPGSPR